MVASEPDVGVPAAGVKKADTDTDHKSCVVTITDKSEHGDSVIDGGVKGDV